MQRKKNSGKQSVRRVRTPPRVSDPDKARQQIEDFLTTGLNKRVESRVSRG